MSTSTITSKGQTTIPKEIREYLDLRPGDKIVYYISHGEVMMWTKNKSVKDLKGIVPKPERAVTIEEMEEAIAKGAVESAMAGLEDE